MFKSFFPSPRLFFLSVVVYSGICSFIWYSYNEQIGEFLGFDLAPAAPVIGLGHFLTDSFLLFYLYYFSCGALFAAFWFRVARHPWQWWSIVGSILILFSTYFSVQVSVAINNWRRPFFDLVQNALGGSASKGADEIEVT
jgi:peptide/bleomycin uptake transporter